MRSGILSLEGRHPYTGAPVAIHHPLLAEVPGSVTGAGKAGAIERRNPECWTALAGPFRIDEEGGIYEPDRQPLLGLVWDLAGYPLYSGGPKRPAAKFHLVEEFPGVITIFRKSTEMLDGYQVEHEAVRREGYLRTT